MKSDELRQKFLDFFEKRGHKIIASAPLVPVNDPTVLFTTAGMHPLVPYLLGENHPAGNRLANDQHCLRTDDIDEVGDAIHHTFFEMLGNWSLGDYFKDDAIKWSYEFLIDELKLDLNKFAVSCFAGDDDAPKDMESAEIWQSLGIKKDRIAFLPKKNNWWGPAGQTGPCGPDTEMFYWTGLGEAPANFQDTNDDPNWVEIWNDVFMQYNKTPEGKFEPLVQQNVDTGMGFERMLAILNNVDDNYATDLFTPIIQKIEELSGKKYQDYKTEFRIITDHLKAATFILAEGITPSNKGQGYVLRRLIRRAIVKARALGIEQNFCGQVAEVVISTSSSTVISTSSHTVISTSHRGEIPSPEAQNMGSNTDHRPDIMQELEKEETKFRKTLASGLKIIESQTEFTGKMLFDLYQTYGIPLEVSVEEAKHLGCDISNETMEQFNNMVREHQELSRTASAGMFKGGLADSGEQTTKLHTAAHLMLAALRQVLGDDVTQKGSNITAERLRFDFNYPEKMTPEQIAEVEKIVNEQIEKDLPVTMQEMSVSEAKSSGAMGVFDERYGDKVKVYTIGPSIENGEQGRTTGSGSNDPSTSSGPPFSREICGGPHVSHLSELGHFKITKEESSSAGIRRIKAILE